jgi:uncharacterized iron-regulated membrane protein
MKRLLFEIHRWVGVALALFMLLWFFSGLVIIYAEPTTPTRAQQLANAESLLPESTWLSAGEAWEKSAAQRRELLAGKKERTRDANAAPVNAMNAMKPHNGADEPVEARLVQQAGQPVWLVEDKRGQHVALSAIDGKLHETTPEQALKIADNWLRLKTGGITGALSYSETIAKPAILRNQEGLSPFHRILVNDSAGSELLISARTGEVVSDATFIQRGFYWAGNWVHLFRPLELTSLSESRVTILTWTAFTVIVATLTGLIVGWLRWRPGLFGKKTYSEGRVHPYRNVWFKFHFWGGLIGGMLALTWGLGGFLNNNPWQIFSPASPSKEELVHYVGGEIPGVSNSWHAEARIPRVNEAEIVEQLWRRLGDETVELALARDGRRLPKTTNYSVTSFSDASLLAAVHRIAGDAPVKTQTLLQEYDSYYYLRFHRDVADRPLPVLLVELGDAAGTHLYIDPQDGRLLARQDSSRRVFRWLYSALHHWDFGWLYHRPLWDAWMLTWVLLGLTLSVTAVVIGWKRLVHTFQRKRHHAPNAHDVQIEDVPKLATENQVG